MSGQQDLPGYSPTQETETLGLLAVQTCLVRHGFKVTEVAGRFDDGLDLLVSPHKEANVLPAIAGIQVRSGPSHHGLKVGRHERYWREHNLPVFGVVLTDPEAEPPRGGWCDAQTYLKAHPGAQGLGIVRVCLDGEDMEQARFPAIMWLSTPMTSPEARACPHIIAHTYGRASTGCARHTGARPVPQPA